jgi:thiamine biosynthesis protein ThiS
MKLNNREFENFKDNMTIKDVIEVMGYTYPRLVIKLNGKLIPKTEYSNTFVKENDDLKIHHLLAGG